MQVPIWVPSAEQTVSPADVQVAEEVVDAEEAEGEAAEGAAGETAGALEDAAGGVATFSSTWTDGTAAAADAGDEEGCTAGGALDCAVVAWPEPPGTVQPIGVHWIPWTLPSPLGATLLNKEIVASMSLNAQA